MTIPKRKSHLSLASTFFGFLIRDIALPELWKEICLFVKLFLYYFFFYSVFGEDVV